MSKDTTPAEPSAGAGLTGDISFNSFSSATIRIAEGTADELENILKQKVDISADAFRHSPVVLNIEGVSNLNDLNFSVLQEICLKHNLFLIGVSGVVNEDRAKALSRRHIPIVNSSKHSRMRLDNIKPKIITQTLEVKVPIMVEKEVQVPMPVEVRVPTPVKIVRRNIRSGETVTGQNCSLVIYGSVSSLAQIISTHNIFVFGSVNDAKLIAGQPKDADDLGLTESIVHVQGAFRPNMLCIAGNYKTAESLDQDAQLQQVLGLNRGITVSLEDGGFSFKAAME